MIPFGQEWFPEFPSREHASTFKEVPLKEVPLHKEVPSSPESSTLKDITERLRSFEGNLEAESSEIDDLKKSVALLPRSEAANRLRDIVRDWEIQAEKSGNNTLQLEPSEVAEALERTEAVMSESLDTDSLDDFQRQATLVARILEPANSFSDAGTEIIAEEIVLPGTALIRLIRSGLNSFGSR